MILFDIRKKLWQGFKIPWFIEWLIDYMLPIWCQVFNGRSKTEEEYKQSEFLNMKQITGKTGKKITSVLLSNP